MVWRGRMLTAAIAFFVLGLLCFLGVYFQSRAVAPVQQAVVSVNITENGTAVIAGGVPADAAEVPVTVVSREPADGARDGSAWNASARVDAVQLDENGCPPCAGLFEKLHSWGRHSRVQEVHMQIRGEPKSGTSFMFEWAVNTLMVTCNQLGKWYGSHSCSIRWAKSGSRRSPFKKITDRVSALEMKVAELLFEMPRHHKHAGSASPCRCHRVDRVTVSISHGFKHNMPVVRNCPWQHIDGVAPEGLGCTPSGGQLVQNYQDVAACVRESPCRINDNRLQMLVLRDPRAVVVSSFYYLKTHKVNMARLRPTESVDAFALRMLPTICRFVHIRYIVLMERMADKTVEFVYDESLADPLEWHRRWLRFAGLNLPVSAVQHATDTALRGDYGFAAKGRDKHPGGLKTTPSRSYETEIGPDVRAKLDEICRVWLPPVLLEKFGVPPP